jgi:hypothetical protein
MKIIIIDIEGEVDILIDIIHILHESNLQEFRFYQEDSTYYPYKIRDIIKIEIMM